MKTPKPYAFETTVWFADGVTNATDLSPMTQDEYHRVYGHGRIGS